MERDLKSASPRARPIKVKSSEPDQHALASKKAGRAAKAAGGRTADPDAERAAARALPPEPFRPDEPSLIFPLQITVDGAPRIVPLTAGRVAQLGTWRSAGEAAFDFDLPNNRDGHLVEIGNSTKFSGPLPMCSIELAPDGRVSIDANGGSFRGDGGAQLWLLLRTAAGLPVRRLTCILGEEPSFSTGHVAPEASRASLAIRLWGSGRVNLGAVKIRLKKPAGETRARRGSLQAEPTSKATVSGESLAVVNSASDAAPRGTPATPADAIKEAITYIEDRRYDAALSLLQALPPSGARDRQLMRVYSTSGRFEEGVALFEAAGAPLQDEPMFRYRYLECCASLGRHEPLANMLKGAAYDLGDRALELLLWSYYYLPVLSPPLRKVVVHRLATATSLLDQRPFQLLKVAHDFLCAGELEAAAALGAELRRRCRTPGEHAQVDLLQSQLAFVMADWPYQIEMVNRAIGRLGSSPVSLIDDTRPLSADNIACRHSVQGSQAGPLVTVIMTTFNSAATVAYAVRSVLQQTHAALELIVVDDRSSDNTVEIVSSIAAQDPRVCVIPLEKNGGTYRAKNVALSRARGEYVTCQDSDDWAHPEKIATLVELLADDAIIGAQVQHIRCSPSLGIQCRSNYIRPDFSSLIYRRLPVLQRAGYYDNVRAGADSEFKSRLTRLFGQSSFISTPKLLSFVAASETTLSGGGAFAIYGESGAFSPVRAAYRRSFSSFHEAAHSLYIPRSSSTRAFAAPSVMTD